MSTQSDNVEKSDNQNASKNFLAKIRDKKVWLPVAILGATLAICFVLIANRPQIEQVPVEIPVTTIRTTTAESQQVTMMVSSRGKVVPALTSEVAAAVSGPVAWISPSLVAGGYFKQGETLLKIESSDFKTALEKSKASAAQAEAEANHAKKELNRITDLAGRKLVSDSQLQDAKRAADVASARLQTATADLAQAKLNLERTELKAPFNAIVELRKIELGQNVTTGQSVATLFGADVVEVKLPLANQQLGYLTIPPGYRGTFKADEAPEVVLTGYYAGEQHRWMGKLVRTEADIDASNNTVQVIVQVSQPANEATENNEGMSNIPLPIGLLVQAEITGKTIDDVIALPRHVIRKNTQVLVALPDNTLDIREVNILRLENDRVLINGGLESGEQVCISPIQAVVDGMPIEVVHDNDA